MEAYRFKLFLPKPNAFGNLLWGCPVDGQLKEFQALCERIEASGLWCSLYPENDGFCFSPSSEGAVNADLLTPEYYTRTTALFKDVFGEGLIVNPLVSRSKINVYVS